MSYAFKSLPVLGVWIEVAGIATVMAANAGHSLYWECGLKSSRARGGHIFLMSLPVLGVWIEVKEKAEEHKEIIVTPCIGSVD